MLEEGSLAALELFWIWVRDYLLGFISYFQATTGG